LENVLIGSFLSISAIGLAMLVKTPPPLPEKITPYPVVANIDFAEGPIFDKEGNLYFVNYIRNGTLGKMAPDGTVVYGYGRAASQLYLIKGLK